MPATQPHIRPFRAGVDEAAFRSLNEAWLTKYFRIEPKDAELFEDPVAQFIAPGGDILMLDADGQTVGCCALINLGEGTFEIAKMAVAETHQRRGYGELLLHAIIDRARELGARRLFIETSSQLPVAIGLYRKLGFTDLPPDSVPLSDYARADVFMERRL
jgi:N-acetylglutamate synthase-like GNAT family acetyltransferase